MNPGDAEVDILSAIAKALAADADSAEWAAKVMARRPGLRRAISAIMFALATAAERDFDARDARAAVDAATRARFAVTRLAKIAPTPSRSLTPTVIAPPVIHANLVREIMPTVLRETDDIFRRVVAEVLALPITTERERLGAVQASLHHATRVGVVGFVDRAGKRWNMTSYLEMATRTALHRSAMDWYAHEISKAGLDLVLVVGHTPCPRCAPFHDTLLSVSGATRGPVGVSESGRLIEVTMSLTEARARGLHHPNCRCTLVASLPGDDYAQNGQLDPQLYRDEQTLRRHERAVRMAKTQLATAITPERQSAAARKVRVTQKALRDHVSATAVRRQRHREQLDSPR